jgi:hypothetical protein
VVPITLADCDPPVRSDRLSRGHRLHADPVVIDSAASYGSTLAAAGVQVSGTVEVGQRIEAGGPGWVEGGLRWRRQPSWQRRGWRGRSVEGAAAGGRQGASGRVRRGAVAAFGRPRACRALGAARLDSRVRRAPCLPLPENNGAARWCVRMWLCSRRRGWAVSSNKEIALLQ